MEFVDEHELKHHQNLNFNTLRDAILSHNNSSSNTTSISSLQVLNEWDTFVDIQLRTVLNHQLLGTYQSSAAAAIAAANGLGASIFGNSNEDLITADMGNFSDEDYLHLGLSFEESGGLEHPEDMDDDGQHPYRDDYRHPQIHHNNHNQQPQQLLDVKSTGTRSIQRNKSVNFDGDDDNGYTTSYRESYNFNKTVILNHNSNNNSNDDKEEAFDDSFMETINFAEFANFENLNSINNNVSHNLSSSSDRSSMNGNDPVWKDNTSGNTGTEGAYYSHS